MGERRGTKALELWCRRITEGYPDVNVQNMTTSWRDGLAFCAMIHHFRPDLIDFDNLDKNDVYGNNELAFRVAEQHLGIPALLDAEDMASCSVPDRLSILTYLSQFYQTLGGSSPARHPVSRTTETVEERITELPESPKEKEATCLGMRKDSCVVCGFPIFLAEKLVLSHVAYHRTCFRCARCSNQLTIGNYYETEEGQYCCERCPDEEISLPTSQSCDDSTYSGILSSDIDSNYTRLLKSEESTSKQLFTCDPTQKLDCEDSIVPDIIAQTSRLRLNFISNQMFSENDDQVTGNTYTNESKNDVKRDHVHLTTGDVNLASPVNHEYGKQSKKESELNSLATSLKQESHDRRGVIEAASEKILNTKGHIYDQLSANKHKLKEISPSSSRDINGEKLSRHKNDKELSKQVDDRTYSKGTIPSIVQERRKIFERKEDQVDKNEGKCRDAEVLTYKTHGKHEVLGNTENSVIIPDTTQTISQDVLSDNLESSSANSSVHAISSDLSESTHEPVVPENLSVSPSNKKSNEDQASTIVVNDTNATNTVAANSVENYPEDLNPFKCDEDEEIIDKSTSTTNTVESSGDLTNPFENDEKTEDEIVRGKETIPPKPAMRNSNKTNQQFLMEKPTKRRLIAPQINLNPFWSDEDDHDSDLDSRERTSEVMPTPKPRTIKHIEKVDINGQKLTQSHNSSCVQSNCIRSPESGSIGGAYRKKKPAPLPPNKKELCLTNQHASSISKSQCSSPEHRDASTHTTPRARKAKPAPPVPTTSNFEECSMNDSFDTSKERNIWEDQKINKDEKNRNKQGFTNMSYRENFHCKPYVDKSIEGKWKRKKGPAPLCPMPCRRKIKVMSLKDVKLELDEIELQQQGLEKQGVRLEQLIRSKCESGSRSNDISLGTDVEELVLELFALVNEKNELFRRQAELMLLRRQQRLEEEHAEVEFQIRCLMTQHESTKTDFDKQREEALIQRLVEIVEKRNEIVDCLEMDRRREIEEDRSIHHHMDLFAARNKNETSSNDINISEKKKRRQNKQKEKVKDKKLKKTLKKDIDKDVDEIELTLKRHNKRKWF